METRTEEIVQQTLREVYEFVTNADEREKNADERAEAIIKSVQDGFKQMAAAHERGLKDIAAALRDLRR